MPDLTLDSCACAVSHLPSYFLLSISCHLNPWVLDCCHLYLPYPLAICQTVQPSVLLWSSEILHLNFPCSDQGPLASKLESQTIICLWGYTLIQKMYKRYIQKIISLWGDLLKHILLEYIVDLFVWLEIENITEKIRP